MEKGRQFVSAVLAGMMIGMGGTVYLSQTNSVVGSFLFAVGLFTVVVFQLHLFTGKIGYLPFQNLTYLTELLITWGVHRQPCWYIFNGNNGTKQPHL